MADQPNPRAHPLLRAADAAAREERFSHPWNPKSELRGVTLSRATGLQRTAVTLIHLPPGKESFVYHRHHGEEEWMYVIAGRGVIDIDGVEHEVGPGDFVGFPAPSVAHHLRNPFDGELTYLSGGESREVEVADFPRLNRRMVRLGSTYEVHALDSAKRFPDAP